MPFPEIPFATIKDLEDRGRTLREDEKPRAEMLLADASQLIMDECPQAANRSALTLERIVCSIVKRAMTPRPVDGAESVQQGAGAYQATVRWANPDGDIYLSGSERRSLLGRAQRAGNISFLGRDDDDDE